MQARHRRWGLLNQQFMWSAFFQCSHRQGPVRRDFALSPSAASSTPNPDPKPLNHQHGCRGDASAQACETLWLWLGSMIQGGLIGRCRASVAQTRFKSQGLRV